MSESEINEWIKVGIFFTLKYQLSHLNFYHEKWFKEMLDKATETIFFEYDKEFYQIRGNPKR